MSAALVSPASALGGRPGPRLRLSVVLTAMFDHLARKLRTNRSVHRSAAVRAGPATPAAGVPPGRPPPGGGPGGAVPRHTGHGSACTRRQARLLRRLVTRLRAAS